MAATSPLREAAYHHDSAWADTFTRDAIAGAGDFEGWEDDALRELATKGAAYGAVLYHVVGLLDAGVEACSAGDAAKAVSDWDAAWAYWG